MGADVTGAHAHLAAIDPAASGEAFLDAILEGLLLGAGHARGALVDTHAPGRRVAAGRGVPAAAVAAFMASDGERLREAGALGEPAARALFGDEPVSAGEARLIPLTAGDETLALLALGGAPHDPVGFASVVAHAASMLAWVRMSEKVREADFELKYRVWELESLYDVGLSIAGTLDLDSLVDDILMKSVSLLNARAGALIVREQGETERLLVKNFGGELVDPTRLPELPDRVVIANTPSERIGALADAGAEKILSVPIRSDGNLLGFLLVGDKETRAGGVDDWGEGDARILSLFGNQAAIALENARLHREAVEKERMEREIEIAASIQRTILPTQLPAVSGLLVFGANRPTRQVGGDYFDVQALPDGRIAFCVADVSGKGVPAALLVSTVHACVHLLIEGVGDLPALVRRANEHLARFSAARKFVTLFIAVFEPKDATFTYVNAGHNPAIRFTNGTSSLLGSTGLPIGMLPNVVHTAETLALQPDDLLVLYSDGITEAIDGKDEEFGLERLKALVGANRSEAPVEVTQRIFAAVDDFTRGIAQYDDQTVLVARVPA